VIRGIQDATGTKIDIDDSGVVTIFSPDTAALELAEGMVNELTQEAELDRVYLGKVKRITDFGAFVEIFPGTDGLVHISQLANHRVAKVTDVVNEGDEIHVKVLEIDPKSGKIRLSLREAQREMAAAGQN
jgi:polyribonucleotide nucleotidyltransferase